jgi:large subunit ribosomal protein L9
MEVILLERIEKLGNMGDVVNVKPGFGRNFLLPQEKALRATKANLARFEAEREYLEQRNAENRTEAMSDGEKLNGTSVTLIRKAGDTGNLYGSVSARDVAEHLEDKGVKRNMIVLENPIKTLGLHDVNVKLHPEVIVSIQVNVARSEDEAERQAQGEDVIAAALAEEKADTAEANRERSANAVSMSEDGDDRRSYDDDQPAADASAEDAAPAAEA